MPFPAHAVTDYYVGRGVVEFKKDGQSDWRDLGNVSVFELVPAVEKLDHFSSRTGVRTKDKSIVLEKSMTVRIVTDNITPHNLELALLGDTPVAGSGGDYSLNIFKNSEIAGEIRFTGANDYGPKVNIHLPDVSLIPSSAIGFISDEWGQIELTGEVLDSDGDGSFGTLQTEAAAN